MKDMTPETIFKIEYPASTLNVVFNEPEGGGMVDGDHCLALGTGAAARSITVWVKESEGGGHEPMNGAITFAPGLSYLYQEDAKLFLDFARQADRQHLRYERLRYLKWALLSAVFAIEAHLNEKGDEYAEQFPEDSERRAFFADARRSTVSVEDKLCLWGEFYHNRQCVADDLRKEFREVIRLRDRLVHAKPDNAIGVLRELTFGVVEKAIRVYEMICKVL